MTLLNSLKLSQQTKKIISASFKEKLKDLPENGWQRVYTILMKWCKFLGIKEVPDQEDMKMILFFMKKNYGELTLDEIVNAFNLAVAHKLNVDPNHYQNFSPLYVSGILNAYKEYKTTHWSEYNIKLDEHEAKLLTENNKPSEEELIVLSYDEKKEILITAKRLLKKEKQRDVKNEFSRKQIIDEINKHTAKTPAIIVLNRCKLIATQKLFENLVADGLDLRDKLSLIKDDRFEINGERELESSVVGEI